MFSTGESNFNSVKKLKSILWVISDEWNNLFGTNCPFDYYVLDFTKWKPNTKTVARVAMARRKAFLLFLTRVLLSASCFSSISDADLSLTDLGSSIDFPQVKTQNSPRFSCRLRSAVRRVAWMFDVWPAVMTLPLKPCFSVNKITEYSRKVNYQSFCA